MSGASSSSDPFARRAQSSAPGRDHFREQAERKAAKGGAPKGDAFAGKKQTAGAFSDPFKVKPREPKLREPKPIRPKDREAKRREPEPAAALPPAYEDFRTEIAPPPPPRHVLSNGAELKVFERED